MKEDLTWSAPAIDIVCIRGIPADDPREEKGADFRVAVGILVALRGIRNERENIAL